MCVGEEGEVGDAGRRKKEGVLSAGGRNRLLRGSDTYSYLETKSPPPQSHHQRTRAG